MESGPIANWASQPLAHATSRFNALARNAGCMAPSRTIEDSTDANNELTRAAGADVVACLRAKNTSEIAAAAHNLPTGAHALVDWNPVIDFVELHDEPQRLAAQHQSARRGSRA